MGSRISAFDEELVGCDTESMAGRKRYNTQARKSQPLILQCCKSPTNSSFNLTPEYQSKHLKRSRKCIYLSPHSYKENVLPGPVSLRNCRVSDKGPSARKLTSKFRKTAEKGSYLAAYFKIFDDDVIQDFLWMDSCYRLSDKYLLAMVYTYFKRAKLTRREYNRTNFFAALYLSHDMEEDNEDLKLEIFPWVLGDQWRDNHLDFINQRDTLLTRMSYRAAVSKKTCHEVMDLCPSHPIWKRERKAHHGGAMRVYPDEDNEFSPRGPNASPLFCKLCAEANTFHSPAFTSGYLSACSSELFSAGSVKQTKQYDEEELTASLIVDNDEDKVLLCPEE